VGDYTNVINRTPPDQKLAALPLPHWIAEPTTGRRVQLYAKGKDDPTSVHQSDLLQRGLSTCFLIGGLSAVIQSHPDPEGLMRDMIKDNGDGTYTVTFFDLNADGTTSEETFDKGDAGASQPAYQQNLYNQQLHPHHTYVVTNVDVAARTVTVHNPWDEKVDIVIPYDQVEKVFTQAQVNPVKYAGNNPDIPPYPKRN
jgi:hypothetical protein